MRTLVSALTLTVALAVGSLSLLPSSAMAANPSLSGSIGVQFAFHPDEPSTEANEAYWYFSSYSGSITLTTPPVMDISINPSVLGPGTLDWSDDENWTAIPLDTGGLSISTTGSGTYTAIVNYGQPNLDVLLSFGPTESQTLTYVEITNIHGSGSAPCVGCGFSVQSNFANTRYNVTLPTGAHLNNDQFQVIVQNLTIESGASLLNPLQTIRGNLVNHGSGNFGRTIEGNFVNDAIAASGNVANTTQLTLEGQLQNTGELYITGTFETKAATGNAGKIIFTGGQFYPAAAFSNTGVIQLQSGTLDGPGVVTNNGTFDWTGGSIAGKVVNATSAFTVSGVGARYLSGSLTNAGTITQSGGSELQINLQNTLTNQMGAVYNITDDSNLSNGFLGGFFNNAGTFRKSGGAGVSLVGPSFTNTGTIRVDTGSMKFTGGGTLNGGAMTFATGTTIDLASGTFAVEGTNIGTGNGQLRLMGGTATVLNGKSGNFSSFSGGAKLMIGAGTLMADAGGSLTLNLSGSSRVELAASEFGSGTLGGEGTVINTGNFLWTAGTIQGNVLNSSPNFTIQGGGMTAYGANFTNSGVITQSGGQGMSIGGQGTLTNQAGALFDILDDSDLNSGFLSGTFANAGTLRKSGGNDTTIVGVNLSNSGTIAVKSGTLQLSGTTTSLASTSRLEFELRGTTAANDFGKISVTTFLLSADGTLAVTFGPGFSPALGASFDLLDWSTIDGTFDTLALPTLGAGLMWNASQLYTDGSLRIAVAGDYNLNGVVDAADYTKWRDMLGRSAAGLAADGNSDGAIDINDYNIWKANFGATGGSGSNSPSQSIPEPATLALLVWSALASLGRRSNKQKRNRC